MNNSLHIKEEPKDADTCSPHLIETEAYGENSYDTALHDPYIKEEKWSLQDLVGNIKVEELKLPASDTEPNEEDLSRSLKNSSRTSIIEATQDCKGKTKKQIFSFKLYGSTYTNTSSVKDHTSIHEHQTNKMINRHLKKRRKAHKCEICEKWFTQKCDLKRHLLIHEGKKPHKCEVCGKSFTQISHLRDHLLIHEGKKLHKCEVCGKSFTCASNLRKHLLIHEGKKPHKCEVCEKSFTCTSNLRRHLLIHKHVKPH